MPLTPERIAELRRQCDEHEADIVGQRFVGMDIEPLPISLPPDEARQLLDAHDACKQLPWTRELPIKTGWYWCKASDDDREQVLYVSMESGSVQSGSVFPSGQEVGVSLHEECQGWSWSGPLEPPASPQSEGERSEPNERA